MRFLLFAGDSYYPNSGWHDFRGYFNTVLAARLHGVGYDWAHVVDENNGEIVPTKGEIVQELRTRLYARAGDIEQKIRKTYELGETSAEGLLIRVQQRRLMVEVKIIIEELRDAIQWFGENIEG